MDKHPIQERVAILSVASCYRNWNKLWRCGPPRLVCDLTFTLHSVDTEVLWSTHVVSSDRKLHSILSLSLPRFING